jgi:UDP-glucose 4-epimerase
MKVVVTGATGNVGTSVVSALAADPRVSEIVGIARRRPASSGSKARFVAADVARDELAEHFRDAAAVIHLAWLIQPSHDRAETRRVNVDGSRRVFEAAAAARVPALIHASSVGAYSPAASAERVDEAWPVEGIASSFYSRDKADAERLLDAVERTNPSMRVVRLRPALIGKATAATGIRRLFLGPLVPSVLTRPGVLPLLPIPRELRLQFVHTDDVAEAYRLALHSEARGAFNIAAEPVMDARRLAAAFRARAVPSPATGLRLAADLTWKARLQPTPGGWVDLAMQSPVLDTRRAQETLGWAPRVSADSVLEELLLAMSNHDELATPPLARASSGPLRWREFATGVGGRAF